MSVSILQISDTHLPSVLEGEISAGIQPWKRTGDLLNTVRQWIADEAIPIDFLIHTGDIVHRGHIANDNGEGTRMAMERIQTLTQRVYWVVGNHDNRLALEEWVGAMPGDSLVGSSRWAYHFIERGERIVVLDARGPAEYDPQGELSDDQLHALETLLRTTREPASIFLHYPPVPLGSDWIDRTMLVRNGDILHRLLRSYSPRVRGVFFGHIHRSSCSLKDGILYASCGSTTMHFPNWPGARTAVPSGEPIAFAQYIQITEFGVHIKPQWISLQDHKMGPL
jgi:Icc protein